MWLTAVPGLAYDRRWFHRWIGAIGNTAFVVGSVFFLFPSLQVLGTWVFIVASSGMMFDSFGEKLVRLQEERHRTAAVKP